MSAPKPAKCCGMRERCINCPLPEEPAPSPPAEPELPEGRVTHDEARAILRRFNASHWNNPGEHARYSIPARPEHDDDLKLARYIDQCEKAPIVDAKDRAVLGEVGVMFERSPQWFEVHLPTLYGLLRSRQVAHVAKVMNEQAALARREGKP